jgi:FkbM family methyltransferase
MLLATYGINAVLDVGASDGGYARELRGIGYHGRLISFEPRAAAFTELVSNAKFDRAWETHNYALGNTQEQAEMNIAGNGDSSSFLDMLPAHTRHSPGSSSTGKETVKIKTLDQVFNSLGLHAYNVLLKIDVQGYEKQVLDGAETSLASINTIQLEMSLTPLYRGQLLLPEMTALLYRQGYCLVSIDPGFRDRKTGRVLQVDGTFHRYAEHGTTAPKSRSPEGA